MSGNASPGAPLSPNVIAWSLAYHIADPLVRKDKNLEIVPLLAESLHRPAERPETAKREDRRNENVTA